nr:Bardet-Biedl syndrome 5 protein homolog [Onthophagus taurus]XP_022901706.1 Bardet-Biedl syndrome 5 protein homolog [Onthophagus taurus]XP_022901714.1 Bardet-Biedl syndrome 5 protein homolog [Onthophagus taurus]XP_022901721.1 Bardet-Biedl syndrome 5 protein homolog [Onthophagus taurus]XP_022901729.1 Bardet-Biedl syndrome 5 protein homolog [Onthophagus taurus]
MASVWEDKEVRFDVPFSDMKLRVGEKLIDRMDNVEDTKGNAGDRGRFLITNLRLVWHSLSSPRINLSIGFNTILTINSKIINSKTQYPTRALHMMTACDKARFEFIFTNLVITDKKHFQTVIDVHRAYISSKPYRELKLRGAIVRENRLKILPLEQIFETFYGVWNLSTDQGSLGTFIITNVRLVWFADTNEGFNVSLPYLQTESVKMCDSKFGPALVVISSEESGSFILGFKLDPEEKMREVFQKLTSVYSVYFNNPIFGVEYEWDQKKNGNNSNELTQNYLIDDLYVLDDKAENVNELSAYLAEENKDVGSGPVFNSQLGLAVQSVKEGYSLANLWEVVST